MADLAAPDFRAVAETLVPDVSLPEGLSWAGELDELAPWGEAENAMMQATGVSVRLAGFARCAWLQHVETPRRRDPTGLREHSQLTPRRHRSSSRPTAAAWSPTTARSPGGAPGRRRGRDYEHGLNCEGFGLRGPAEGAGRLPRPLRTDRRVAGPRVLGYLGRRVSAGRRGGRPARC